MWYNSCVVGCVDVSMVFSTASDGTVTEDVSPTGKSCNLCIIHSFSPLCAVFHLSKARDPRLAAYCSFGGCLEDQSSVLLIFHDSLHPHLFQFL